MMYGAPIVVRKCAALSAIVAGLCLGASNSRATVALAESSSVEQAKALDEFGSKLLRDYERQRGIAKPNLNNLFDLARSVPPLAPIEIPHARSVFMRDRAVINQAYESGGKLFMPADDSPQMGIHKDALLMFDTKIEDVRLSPDRLSGLFFSHISANDAILQGFTASDLSRNYYWQIHDGMVKTASAPGEPTFAKQDSGVERCSVVRTSGVKQKNDVDFAQLVDASHGIALQAGVEARCRHVASQTLVWLTAGGAHWDGVTYAAVGKRLVPLFRGHPFIETAHYLVFTNYVENSDGRSYLFLRF